MNQIYNRFTFIVAFMVFVVFFNMFFGTKPTEYLLLLILLGMVLSNIDSITGLFKNSMTVNQ